MANTLITIIITFYTFYCLLIDSFSYIHLKEPLLLYIKPLFSYVLLVREEFLVLVLQLDCTVERRLMVNVRPVLK